MTPFWERHSGSDLRQGDYLPRCWVPAFGPDLGSADEYTVPVKRADLIVMTHSCDLGNNKARFVALCPIHNLSAFELGSPKFAQKGKWEEVRKGRQEGLHLLASPSDPEKISAMPES